MPNDSPSLLPLGPDGVLIRFADRLSEPANRAALAFRAAMIDNLPTGVDETATSLTSVFVRFRPDDTCREAIEDVLRTSLAGTDWYNAPLPQGRNRWLLPTSFGGADGPALEEAADLAGVSAETAVEEICANPLRVLTLGFAPGQPYLGFLPDHWDIPRQSDVTPQVPRGAVVVAVRQVIPFANPSPTGWRQIGRTAFRCYDPKQDPALPLNPGDEVGFFPVTTPDLIRFENVPYGGAKVEPL
ncbi:MAG: carboxyltransferase domain-containing protein [Paracoccaceae bacterium]